MASDDIIAFVLDRTAVVLQLARALTDDLAAEHLPALVAEAGW